ncbi:DNA topoisomerase III [Nematocida homosporus]|uniref:DNA topoisomerase III n=1 Tax=Nematocida homosporus TaxID=1912981 RepID=UPI00221ECBFB|nr:DNA topoisomerase III [Nematocida homosporus]KAI5186314.1 DNA topoisomerase III [Nematocida homosporus]
MRILNVAEKPSVARALTEILSKGKYSTRSSPSKYCKNFVFSYNQAEMLFTSVLGHLYSLEFRRKSKWRDHDPKELFEADIVWEVAPTMLDVSTNLLNVAQGCSQLVIWTDCDREGENIGEQIAGLLREKIQTVKRARFSGLGPYEVTQAFRALGELNVNEAHAVSSRIEVDLRIGAALTRLQTLQLEALFQDQENKVVSYGSCQIPTLGFVCEREELVAQFVPEPNWTINAKVRKGRVEGEFQWTRGKIFDQTYVDLKYQHIQGQKMVVTEVSKKEVQKSRPIPLRTVEMQKFFARKGPVRNSHELMEIAEKLYTSGYISYPRTETDAFPKDFNAQEPLQRLKNDPVLGDYARKLNPGRASAGPHSDQAHTPIYPIKEGTGLSGASRAVYEYIARRFLAVYSQNAKGQEEAITCQVKGETFRRRILHVVAKNYLEVYVYDKWGDTEESLPVKEGECVEWTGAIKPGSTEPPTFLTEADLIAKMDTHGIGTDATIHDHIQRIKERGYVTVVDKNSLKSTWIGRGLINGYKKIGLKVSAPHLRQQFELSLKSICAGTLSPQSAVQQEVQLYKDIYTQIERNMHQLIQELEKNKLNDQNNPPPLPRAGKPSSRANALASAKFTTTQTATSAKPSLTTPKSRSQPLMSYPKSSAYQENQPPAIPPTGTSKSRPQKSSSLPASCGFVPASELSFSPIPTRKRSSSSFDDNNSFLAELAPDTIVCDCNIQAMEKTVNKSGPNKGKIFYGCSSQNCEFFQWKDSTTTNQLTRKAPKPIPIKSKNKPASSYTSTDHEVKCHCGADAKLLTSNTEKNKNREFFKCNKSYKPCPFFVWRDEAES